MRKITFLLLVLFAFSANAQIFNHKRVLDKFDDDVLSKRVKTLITKDDTSFTIEEKGGKPETYIVINFANYNSAGSKDSIVNLINNVYGYQECWCVVKKKDYVEYSKTYLSAVYELDESKRHTMIENMVKKYCYYITHRVVTTQYTGVFMSEYVWVQKDSEGGRTIYSNE